MVLPDSSRQIQSSGCKDAELIQSRRTAYPPSNLQTDDEGTVLDEKWRRWVQRESFLRLSHAVFKHDMYMTTTKVRNPLISYADMTLPLPSNRELWLAPTATAWKTLYLCGDQRHTVSLCELLADNDAIRYLPESVDKRLANKVRVERAESTCRHLLTVHAALVIRTRTCGSDVGAFATGEARQFRGCEHQPLTKVVATVEVSESLRHSTQLPAR